jgi:AcrR family transcriptional regulator
MAVTFREKVETDCLVRFQGWDDSAMSEVRRQERWTRTRSAILDGAMACLVEHGYAGLTMQRVQDASGISRGALTHHFGSMRDLAVAAIEHLAAVQVEEVRAIAASGSSLEDTVEALHAVMRQPTFVAGLELWVAARTDPALRAALTPGARRTGRELRELFAAALGRAEGDPDVIVFVGGLLALLRGLAVGAVLRDRPDVERAVVAAWVATAHAGASGPA